MRKGIIIVLVLAILSANNVFASKHNNASEQQITVTRIENPRVVDNSALPIKITKSVNGVSSLVYTGPLGGYESGKWSDADFSTAMFTVILTWGSDEVFYIFPLNENEQNLAITSNTAPITTYDELEISSSIKINGVNVGEENVRIIDNADMTCNFTVSNTNNSPRKLTIIVATYTQNGSLNNTRTFPIEVVGNSYENINFVYRFDGENENTAKLMFWDSLSGMMPVKASINFSKTSGINAYYYNNDNRLLQIDKVNGQTISYTYDNMGNLLTKTVSE